MQYGCPERDLSNRHTHPDNRPGLTGHRITLCHNDLQPESCLLAAWRDRHQYLPGPLVRPDAAQGVAPAGAKSVPWARAANFCELGEPAGDKDRSWIAFCTARATATRICSVSLSIGRRAQLRARRMHAGDQPLDWPLKVSSAPECFPSFSHDLHVRHDANSAWPKVLHSAQCHAAFDPRDRAGSWWAAPRVVRRPPTRTPTGGGPQWRRSGRR